MRPNPWAAQMDPALGELLYLRDRGEAEAIIRLDRATGVPPGVRLVAKFGSIATCRIDTRDIVEVRSNPSVRSLKASRPLGPERTRAHPRGHRRRSDERRPSSVSLTGAGVVVGVVDWGFDLAAPSLCDNGTRVLALWDQRGGARPESPQPYGYGRLLSRGSIDRAIVTSDPYGELAYHPGEVDGGGGAHGTHVTDIAAGNGRGDGPMGLAPSADLVLVHLANRDTTGLASLGDSVRLLEAISFISRIAGTRPWVINCSLGRCGGPHDGSELVSLAWDQMLASRPNRAIVQSVGNYYAFGTHASGRVSPGRVTSIAFTTDPRDVTQNEVEVWYLGSDEFEIEIVSPGGYSSGPVALGARRTVRASPDRAAVGRIYHRPHDPNNGDHHIDMFLDPDAPAGEWTMLLRPVRVTDGRFHAWIERDEACSGCQSRFVDPDPSSTTGTIANGHLPIVVGAYDGHRPDRPQAPFSSVGPTRDGRAKPDILAPGVRVLAARSAPIWNSASGGAATRKSGTSMAAPHVTGTVALCLQARSMDVHQLRRLVLLTAEASSGSVSHGSHRYLNTEAAVATAIHGRLSARRDISGRPLTRTREELTMERTSATAARRLNDRPQEREVLVRVPRPRDGSGRTLGSTDPVLVTSNPGLVCEPDGPGWYAAVTSAEPRPSGVANGTSSSSWS